MAKNLAVASPDFNRIEQEAGLQTRNGMRLLWLVLNETVQRLNGVIADRSVTRVTLSSGQTGFNRQSLVMVVTGDSGGNTIATIGNGGQGTELFLVFTNNQVTITDDDTHSTDSIDLKAAYTSKDDEVLHLFHDGVSWYESSRSTN